MRISSIIALVFISFSSQTLIGQILYGLKKTVNGSMSIPFDVVNIDPSDGSTSIVLSTNSLIGVAAGATTYDQMNSRYICWGYDNQNNQNDEDKQQQYSHYINSPQTSAIIFILKSGKYGNYLSGYHQRKVYYVICNTLTDTLFFHLVNIFK